MSSESNESRSESPRTPSRGTVLARVVALAVVGALAAVLAHLAISPMTDVFQLSPELAALGGGQIPGAEDQARMTEGMVVVSYKHSALWLGTAGLILGGLFGVVLGVFRRPEGSLWCSALGGALAGGLFGCAAGPFAVYVERFLDSRLAPHQSNVPDHQLILMHAATWLVIGAGIGLGVGMGASGKRARTAVASMALAAIAGMLGGALYLFLAGILLPLSDTTLPIPDGASERILWLGLPAVMIGLALGRKG